MTELSLDLSLRYSVSGWRGIAFRVLGDATYVDSDDEDGEELVREGWVRVVMVGDDRVMEVEVDELTALADDASCSECGQIGCTADGRER